MYIFKILQPVARSQLSLSTTPHPQWGQEEVRWRASRQKQGNHLLIPITGKTDLEKINLLQFKIDLDNEKKLKIKALPYPYLFPGSQLHSQPLYFPSSSEGIGKTENGS